MKHVWILNHYAQTLASSGITRHYHLAKHLPAHGWSASVIASSVDLHTKAQRLAKGETRRLETIGETSFLWLRTPRYERNDGRRILNILAYTLRVLLPWNLRGLQEPDAILGSSVHPLAAWAAALLARRKKVPFIFEVRDLWPQTLIDMGAITPNGLPARALRALEKWLYKQALYIVVLLPKASDYIAPLGVAPERIVWIPNGVDLQDFPSPSPAPEEPPVFNLMYFGAHGEANGLAPLIEAMALLKGRDLPRPARLRMIGDGPEKPALMQLTARLEVENISFEPAVAKTKIPVLAREADAFVFVVRDLPLYRYGISLNKMFDYLAAARPILYAGAAVNNVIGEAKAGLTVPPENPSVLADAIERLVSLPPEERAEMGRNGRAYVEKHHAFSHLAGLLADVLNKSVKEHAQ